MNPNDSCSAILAGLGSATVHSASSEAVELGDVVNLAVQYGVNLELAKKLGDRRDGKVVIDITNPLNPTYSGLVTAPGTSLAEELAKVVPIGAKVVKAFNTTFAGTLVAGKVGTVPLDVFIAGDDEGAKKKVLKLLEDGGMIGVDAGPLYRAANWIVWGCWGSPCKCATIWASPPAGN